MNEIESLQERVAAIRETGDPDLAARAWHALSQVLFAYTPEKTRTHHFPIIKRVNVSDIDLFLADLRDKRASVTRYKFGLLF